MGKSSSPPPAPDYAAAAQQQGQYNLDAARLSGYMSNPNINSPYGSQTVTWGSDPNHPDQATVNQTLNPESQKIFDQQQSLRLGLANLGGSALNTVQGVLNSPFQYQGPGIQTSLGDRGSVDTSGLHPDWYQAQLSPGSSGTIAGSFNQGGNVQNGFNSGGPIMGADAIGQIASRFGEAGGGPSGDQFGMAGANVDRGPINYGPQMGQYGLAQQRLNTSNVAQMPVNAGTTGQNAIMSRLMPQIQQQQAAKANQLANQGIVQGSEAYNNAMTLQGQQQNDLLTQASLQGINLDMSANNQGFNQALQSGQFANQGQQQNYNNAIATQGAQNSAQNQNFNQSFGQQNLQNQAIGQNFAQAQAAQGMQNSAIGQNQSTAQRYLDQINAAQQQQYNQNMGQASFGNQAQQQQYNQNLGQAQFGNQAQQQNYNQNMGNAQFYNQGQQQNFNTAAQAQNQYNQNQNQNFNQGLASAQFGNTAQQQNYQQQVANRQMPLNEINALMSSSQIQNPQFQGYQGQQVQPTPYMQGVNNQYQSAMNAYGMENANNNAFNSGLFGLGSAFLGRR